MPHYTILPAFLSTDAARSAAFFLLSLFLFFRFAAAIASLPVSFAFIDPFYPLLFRFCSVVLSVFLSRPLRPLSGSPLDFRVRLSSLRPCLFPVPAFSPDAPLFSSFFFLLPAPTVFPYLFPLSSSSLSSPTPLLFPSRLSTRIFSARSPPFP